MRVDHTQFSLSHSAERKRRKEKEERRSDRDQRRRERSREGSRLSIWRGPKRFERGGWIVDDSRSVSLSLSLSLSLFSAFVKIYTAKSISFHFNLLSNDPSLNSQRKQSVSTDLYLPFTILSRISVKEREKRIRMREKMIQRKEIN